MNQTEPVTHDLPGVADSLISSCRGRGRKVISWKLWTEGDWTPRIRQVLGSWPERILHFYCILFGGQEDTEHPESSPAALFLEGDEVQSITCGSGEA